VRVVDDKPFAQKARVVINDAAVQQAETLDIDEHFAAARTIEDGITRPCWSSMSATVTVCTRPTTPTISVLY
jgi:hypothetical protein